MRGLIPEGPRPNSGLEPHFFIFPRYLFLVVSHMYPSGKYVASRTKLYGVATQKVALIIFDSSCMKVDNANDRL
jgi:hypothetical protein